KAVARSLRTERPSVSGLTTGKAGAPVCSEILEESVLCCYCTSSRLKRRDSTAWIRVYLQLRNDRRRLLRVSGNIGEKPLHFAGVRDRAGPRGGRAIGLPALSDCRFRGGRKQRRYRQAGDSRTASCGARRLRPVGLADDRVFFKWHVRRGARRKIRRSWCIVRRSREHLFLPHSQRTHGR